MSRVNNHPSTPKPANKAGGSVRTDAAKYRRQRQHDENVVNQGDTGAPMTKQQGRASDELLKIYKKKIDADSPPPRRKRK